MSKGYNKNGLFVDTGLLRDHVSKLREERKLASRLYESVAAMKSGADPTVAYQYDPILRDIERMAAYFGRMADTLSHVCDDANQLSKELGAMIKNESDLTRYISSKNFML